jgi:hypothetical protein
MSDGALQLQDVPLHVTMYLLQNTTCTTLDSQYNFVQRKGNKKANGFCDLQ